MQLLMCMASARDSTRTIWSREDIAYCHCPCSDCMGKAVSRSTEYSHWENACVVAARNAQPPTSTASDQERKTLQEKIALIQSDDEVDVAVNSAATNDAFDDSEVLRESAARNDTFDDSEVLCESEYVMYENPFQIDIRSAAEMSVENTILHAVLNAMKIQQEFSGSQEQFMRILNYDRDLYCKGDSGLQNRWPSSWQSCVAILQAQGYTEPRKLYICLDEEHPFRYDVMDSPISTCK